MLGDVLIIHEKHRTAGEIIIQEILRRKKDRFIIAVSGESGSGKTVLSHVIAKGLRKFSIFAKPLHTDNYYKTLPLERTDFRLKFGVENVVGYSEYNWDLLNENILDFKNKRKSSMPCVDLVTEQLDTLITDFSNVDMLIADGLYAIKLDNSDLKIFIDISYHESLNAQLIRGKEKLNEFRINVLEQEHKMVSALSKRADILINKDFSVKILK